MRLLARVFKSAELDEPLGAGLGDRLAELAFGPAGDVVADARDVTSPHVGAHYLGESPRALRRQLELNAQRLSAVRVGDGEVREVESGPAGGEAPSHLDRVGRALGGAVAGADLALCDDALLSELVLECEREPGRLGGVGEAARGDLAHP